MLAERTDVGDSHPYYLLACEYTEVEAAVKAGVLTLAEGEALLKDIKRAMARESRVIRHGRLVALLGE